MLWHPPVGAVTKITERRPTSKLHELLPWSLLCVMIEALSQRGDQMPGLFRVGIMMWGAHVPLYRCEQYHRSIKG